MRKYSVLLIVSATCLLVLAPLCSVLVGPAGYARWLLAQAANEFQRNRPDQAHATLAKALESSVAIAADEEYWDLRFQLAHQSQPPDPTELELLKKDAIRLLPNLDDSDAKQRACLVVADLFHKQDETRHAIDILQTVFPQMSQRTPMINNNLAYFRSLEKVDLPLALKEINAAIDTQYDAGFLDTKAWILHRMNKNEEAFKFANASVENMYKSFLDGEIAKRLDESYSSSPKKPSRVFYEMMLPDESLIKPPEGIAVEVKVLSETDSKTNDNQDVDEDDRENDDRENDGQKKEDEEAMATQPNSSSELANENSIEIGKPLDRDEIIDRFQIRFSNTNRIWLEHELRAIAVLRYHRSCIAYETGRFDVWERDSNWLDFFQFNDHSKLK
jgi:hypothetical protein